MEDWDEYIQKASILIEAREKYQRVLGELAFRITKEYGSDKLKDFSRDLKETHGLSLSYSTLKNYRWVYEKTHNLNLPEDLAYRTLQYIASSGKPEYWAKKIIDEGLSSADVFRLMRQDKGLDKEKEHKTLICPRCGEMFEDD